MVVQPEQLLESLLDLERSRQRERDIRLETESLLNGLRFINEARGRQELFQALLEALKNVLTFDHAFILEAAENDRMAVLDTTFEPVRRTNWQKGDMFKRSLTGRPVAAYDISRVPEWKNQPLEILREMTSALHIGLQGGEWSALLIVTHKSPHHFGPRDIKKAIRFSPLATQAFLTLELQRAIIQRDRFFQLSMDVMAIFDADGCIRQSNMGWAHVLEYEKKDVQGKDIFSFTHPSDAQLLKDMLHILQKTDGRQLIEIRFLARGGREHWLSCSLASYQNEELFYCVARDVTDRVTYEKRLSHQAGHDSLTGLKNRAEFMSLLERAFQKHASRRDYLFAVFFLDLNKFKIINDTLGHEAGDELLKFFAESLKEVIRGKDAVARLGGDEFSILLCEIQDESLIPKVVERIHQKCAAPVSISGEKLQVSTSIGVAISSSGFENGEKMLKAADRAMYQAKADKSLPFVMCVD